jgi:hypothetical protein
MRLTPIGLNRLAGRKPYPDQARRRPRRTIPLIRFACTWIPGGPTSCLSATRRPRAVPQNASSIHILGTCECPRDDVTAASIKVEVLLPGGSSGKRIRGLRRGTDGPLGRRTRRQPSLRKRGTEAPAAARPMIRPRLPHSALKGLLR